MGSLKEKIDLQNLPRHVAIIMDGNGRWAKKKGALRVLGHQHAIGAVRETIEGAADIGVKFVTLYVFSTENWQRPEYEVKALMELLVNTLEKETPRLNQNNVRLKAIGNLDELPPKARAKLQRAMDATAGNKGLTLILALSYGGRWDILRATRQIARDVKEGKIDPAHIDEKMFSSCLSTAEFPDPELMIRTSGEFRISNFLLWEIAYAEIYITEKLWPDFTREDLYEAILNYQSRERRFGKTSEQIQAQ